MIRTVTWVLVGVTMAACGIALSVAEGRQISFLEALTAILVAATPKVMVMAGIGVAVWHVLRFVEERNTPMYAPRIKDWQEDALMAHGKTMTLLLAGWRYDDTVVVTGKGGHTMRCKIKKYWQLDGNPTQCLFLLTRNISC